MFFSRPGEYAPCRMYSKGHIILFITTLISIAVLLLFTKKCKEEHVKKIITRCTILLWILEIIKIVFNLAIGNADKPNNYLPFYYCSIILYAGILSSFCNGVLKKIGDVFIATGSIIGGIFFMCCPNTSLPMYPAFHYISVQSFIFHGTMLYLGILVNITNYINLKLKDLKYYTILICIALVVAYVTNRLLDTNFMFISKNFPNTPVEVIYNNFGKYFTAMMSVMQILVPFFIIYILKKLSEVIGRRNIKHESKQLEVKKEFLTK